MRILHTSDWHLGRTLEGRSRFEEQVKFVDELCEIVQQEKVKLVLIAGDIFDSVNPSAAAEELYYDALDRLADGGKRAVVVTAGNHDSPDRLCAASPLAGRYGITLAGYPKDVFIQTLLPSTSKVATVNAGQGYVELSIPGCQHNAVIALLPYPSEARLNEVISITLDEEDQRKGYSERVQQLFAGLATNFREDTINLCVSHIYMRGGIESDSERPFQLGGALTVDPQAIAKEAHYVALGHLHRPQAVHEAKAPTRYSGSPLSYSFSEVGYTKSVVLVDALPGQQALVKEIYLTSGYPLVKWEAKEGLTQVYKWIDEEKDKNAWIDLDLHLIEPLGQQDIAELRRLRERIVNIRPIFPQTEEIAGEARAKLPLDEMFRRFFRRQNAGAEADDELVALFLKLVGKEEEA